MSRREIVDEIDCVWCWMGRAVGVGGRRRRYCGELPGFLAFAVGLGNLKGSGTLGEEHELRYELAECEAYKESGKQAYPSGRCGTNTA